MAWLRRNLWWLAAVVVRLREFRDRWVGEEEVG